MQRYTPEQAAEKRAEVLAGVHRAVTRVMDRHPELQSAAMLVAQYWSDEAEDAVHCDFVFSRLPEPDLAAFERAWQEGEGEDAVNLPPGLSHHTLSGLAFGYDREAPPGAPPVNEYDWDSNDEAIPLFAAFTPEGAHQEMSPVEASATYALFRRGPGGIRADVVGRMLRPWLDGVEPVLPEDPRERPNPFGDVPPPPAATPPGWLERLLASLGLRKG
jgi:hypothetical protein